MWLSIDLKISLSYFLILLDLWLLLDCSHLKVNVNNDKYNYYI